MGSEPRWSQQNLFRAGFELLNVSAQSVVFGVKALPKAKWAVAIGIAVTSSVMLVEWLVIANAPNFFDENSTSTLFDLATNLVIAAFDIVVVIPIIWGVAYSALFDRGINFEKEATKHKWQVIIAIAKIYIVAGFIMSIGSSVSHFVRAGLLRDHFGGQFAGVLLWHFLVEALPLVTALLATYFWAVFLLAIPLALEGRDKPMRRSAQTTQNYIWHGFGLLLLSGGFFALISQGIAWVFDFLPPGFDKPVDVVLTVVSMLIYASSILATVYIAHYVNGGVLGQQTEPTGSLT
jgi:hypothetical protein